MREILFRAKPLDEKRWVYGYLLRDKIAGYMIQEIEELNSFVHVQEDTIEQYTGLQDKNGAKIFEGDIVKLDCWCVGKERGNFSNFEVKFIDDGFFAGRNHLGSWIFDSINGNTKLRDVEVIDNIHDNPELLGEEHDAEK